jgi:hypothetical protein
MTMDRKRNYNKISDAIIVAITIESSMAAAVPTNPQQLRIEAKPFCL